MKNGENRQGKFIAVANMKGGVGKTTTVVSLAEALAADDVSASVLVVDLDPQASASLCLAGDDLLAELIEQGKTLQDFLELRFVDRNRAAALADFIRKHVSATTHASKPLSIALLPCGPRLRFLTKRNFSMNAIEGQIWKVFEIDFSSLKQQFDFVIFDCPPSISPFSEVAIRASDLVIVPTIPDRISNFGLDAFCNGIWTSQLSNLPPPPRPHVLITRLQQNVNQHRLMIARLEAEAAADNPAFHLLASRIPQSAALANALSSDERQSFTRRYTLHVAQVLEPLVTEIKGILNADRH